MSAQWMNPRGLAERIVVKGRLTLETPAHFGNGDGDGLLDMPLHLDPLEGKALIAGASLAGALRNYSCQREPDITQRLFGDVYDDRESDRVVRRGRSEESMVIIDDALGPKPIVELRDGVAINPATRTAADKMKFDIELLAAETTFDLSFELMVPAGNNQKELVAAFAYALQGLESGNISLGKRKRRGFGRCSAGDWQVERFDMTTTEGMLEWLRYDAAAEKEPSKGDSICQLLDVDAAFLRVPVCTITATCLIDGSLLVRSTPSSNDSPDAVHLRSRRNGENVPVLSGTSLAGALRARALRIGNTLSSEPEYGYHLVDDLFGYRPKDKGDKNPMTASRVWVEEMEIKNPLDLVHTRVKIDRFTGGAYPGALFSEQPVFGKLDTCVQVKYALTDDIERDSGTAQEKEALTKQDIGLLLLLLKDLWIGDLPLGGEISIGRGRLRGESATIEIGGKQWTIQNNHDKGELGELVIEGGEQDELEKYVQAFVESAA